MAISATDRVIIEMHSGPILTTEETAVEASITLLGGGGPAALARLRSRYTRLLMSPADVSSDNDRVNHAANLKRLAEAVKDLAASVTRSPDLTDAGRALVDSLLASGVEAAKNHTTSMDIIVSNSRN